VRVTEAQATEMIGALEALALFGSIAAAVGLASLLALLFLMWRR
jgi:hypothetical protein